MSGFFNKITGLFGKKEMEEIHKKGGESTKNEPEKRLPEEGSQKSACVTKEPEKVSKAEEKGQGMHKKGEKDGKYSKYIWEAHYDGNTYTASIYYYTKWEVRESLWIIDKETFENVDTTNSESLICKGKSVYGYEYYNKMESGYIHEERVKETCAWYFEKEESEKEKWKERIKKCIKLEKDEEHIVGSMTHQDEKVYWQLHYDGQNYTALFDVVNKNGQIEESLWRINKEIFEKSKNRYSAEKYIQTGKSLCRYRHSKQTKNITSVYIYDEQWKELCKWYFEKVNCEKSLPEEIAQRGMQVTMFEDLSEQQRWQAMYQKMLEIWEKSGAECFETSELVNVESLSNRLSELEKTIDKEIKEMESLQKKVDSYSDWNQLFSLGDRVLSTQEEVEQIQQLKESVTQKKWEAKKLTIDIEKNFMQKIQEATYTLVHVNTLKETGDGFKKAYESFFQNVIEGTEFVSKLADYPVYKKIENTIDKKLVDSYITWAGIQNRITKLLLNPVKIYADGSYELNLEFEVLYRDILEGEAASYGISEQAKMLKCFMSKPSYAEYLWALCKYNHEFHYNRISQFSNYLRDDIMPYYIQFQQSQCIILNQLFKECRNNGTDYQNVLGDIREELKEVFRGVESILRYNEATLWGILWDGIEVDEECLSMLMDCNSDELHDEKRYIAVYLQWSLGYSNDVFNMAGSPYLYHPYNKAMPNGDTTLLARQCAKDVGLANYKLRHSLTCMAPSRLKKGVAFCGLKGAEKFLEEEVKKCYPD